MSFKIKNKVMQIIIWIVVVAIILFFAGMIMQIWCGSNLTYNQYYGIPELIYYSVQVIGVLMTTAAVFVALFGKEIRAFLFKEHCKVYLTNGGITENLGDTKGSFNPQAQSFDCYISITNDGSREISECQVFLREVYYKNTTEAKFKRINSYENKSLYWKIPENTTYDFSIGETKRVPLFKIYPQNSCETPDQTQYSNLRMRIIGCNLLDKYSKQGIWKTVYEIRSKEKTLKNIEMIFQWTGKWCNRLTEMSDEVNVKIDLK